MTARGFCTDFESSDMSERKKGTVKWFDPKKGFGFISRNDDGQDYFVHFSHIDGQAGHRSLEDGDTVEFVPGTDARTGKIVATKVTGEDGKPARTSSRAQTNFGGGGGFGGGFGGGAPGG